MRHFDGNLFPLRWDLVNARCQRHGLEVVCFVGEDAKGDLEVVGRCGADLGVQHVLLSSLFKALDILI